MSMGRQMDPREILTGAEWLIAGGTLMATTWIGTKKLYRLAKNVDETLHKVDTVGANLAKLDGMMSQLGPNDGNSLYDKVHRIMETQAVNSEAISAINGRLTRLERYQVNTGTKAAARRAKRNGK
jgi:hypothetical protein